MRRSIRYSLKSYGLSTSDISRMDGWMTWNFKAFSTPFQSYQDDGWLIIKGNGAPFTADKISPRAGIEVGPLDQ